MDMRRLRHCHYRTSFSTKRRERGILQRLLSEQKACTRFPQIDHTPRQQWRVCVWGKLFCWDPLYRDRVKQLGQYIKDRSLAEKRQEIRLTLLVVLKKRACLLATEGLRTREVVPA